MTAGSIAEQAVIKSHKSAWNTLGEIYIYIYIYIKLQPPQTMIEAPYTVVFRILQVLLLTYFLSLTPLMRMKLFS